MSIERFCLPVMKLLSESLEISQIKEELNKGKERESKYQLSLVIWRKGYCLLPMLIILVILLLLLLSHSVMSDSVRPHRRQPTRLPHPWDSPGKNTGVGCHFLLQCMKVKSEKWKWSRSVVSDPQRPHGLQPSRLLCPWEFPGKSTGVGCHCLLRILYLKTPKYI